MTPGRPRAWPRIRDHPTVLNVGDVVGAHDGDNPHRWYNPTDVQTVIKQLVADYQQLDPVDGAYFAQQEARFNTVALAQYNSLIASIKATYRGTPVGASESIFSMLAPALGLNLITPYSFLRAISEGTDVTAADKTTIDSQIQDRQIKIYVYNSQNVTPDVQAQLALVKQGPYPLRHHHRDALAAQCDLPGVAGEGAQGHPGCAGQGQGGLTRTPGRREWQSSA